MPEAHQACPSVLLFSSLLQFNGLPRMGKTWLRGKTWRGTPDSVDFDLQGQLRSVTLVPNNTQLFQTGA